MTFGLNAATVLRKKRRLGNDIQAGEQPEPFIKDVAHDVRVPCTAEEFQRQDGPNGVRRRDHLGAGKARFLYNVVKGGLGQHGQKQEEAAKLGVERPLREVQAGTVGHGGFLRP